MLHHTRLAGRRSLLWLGCAVLLGLSGCAELPQEAGRRAPSVLVYPSPPDEARFIYERTIRGSADVEDVKEDSTLKELLTGTSARAGEPLRKPYAIAVHRGRIFVSDTAARLVKVFDVSQGRYFEIGDADPPAQLVKPIGLDVDDAGNLYVADATAKAIMVYDRDGQFLRQLGGVRTGEQAFFDRLASVTVDAQGKRAYVVDIGGVRSENHRVRVLDAQTGAHLYDIGKRGSGPGEFNLPRDVVIGQEGKLYVVDGGNFRIQVFDAEGKYLQSFGSIGRQFGNMARPKEAAADAAGNLYVIDTLFGNFQIFNPAGEMLMFIGALSNEDKPAGYSLPSGITVDEDGRIYVVDQAFKKVDIFRPAALGAQEGYLVRKRKAAP